MSRIKLIITLFLLVSAFCISEPKIIFRVSEYPPYYFLEDGSWKGLSVELINILLNEAGYSAVYKELPWKRALVEMKYGHIDVMANLSITEDRNEFIYFVGPQMNESMVMFFSKDSEYSITHLDDIKHISGKIGIQLGASYGAEFDSKFKTDKDFKSNFIEISDGNLYGDLYKNKRLIGFIDDRYVFYYKQRINNEYKDLKEHPFIINQDSIYFGFSKSNFTENDIERFQTAYNRVIHRGEFKVVLDKYRSSDLQ